MAMKNNNLTNLIFSSTAAVYKYSGKILNEKNLIKPKSAYAKTKLECEKIIKNSKDTDSAKKNLLSKKWKIKKSIKLITLIDKKKNITSYQLSTEQVNAILELRLQKLTALGINEIEVEIKKLAELIAKYKKIISSKKELLKVISGELKNIKEKSFLEKLKL